MKINPWTILLLSIGMVSCNELPGTTTVTEPMNLIKKGDTVTVPVGQYKSEFKYYPKDREIKLNMIDVFGNRNLKVYFKVPPHLDLANHQGDFEIRATESGQPVDLRGVALTQNMTTPTRRTMESCTYTTQERYCEYHPPRHRCGWRTVTHWGHQVVEYYDRIQTRSVTAAILDPQTSLPKGQFAASKSDNDRVYTYQGVCR